VRVVGIAIGITIIVIAIAQIIARIRQSGGAQLVAPFRESQRSAVANHVDPALGEMPCDRPRGGMIYFEGGSDDFAWRCDYINGVARGLGFDT
jgi:hypothetical protein